VMRHRHSIANEELRHREFAIKHLMELIDNGIKVISEHSISNDTADRWLEYSQRIVEISSRSYDSNIYLNYLRLIMSVHTEMVNYPHQKIKTCLDYLLEVVKILHNNQEQLA